LTVRADADNRGLYRAWVGNLTLGQAHILAEASIEAVRVKSVFVRTARNPDGSDGPQMADAWGVLVVPGPTAGSYRLADPS
jgi:hypothetical protein